MLDYAGEYLILLSVILGFAVLFAVVGARGSREASMEEGAAQICKQKEYDAVCTDWKCHCSVPVKP